MKSITGIILAAVVTAFAFQGCGVFSKRFTKSETVQYQINASGKQKVKLENILGSIVITQNDNSEALKIKALKEVKVKKKFLNTPFDEIVVKIDTTTSVINIMTEINKKGEDNIFKFDIDKGQSVDYEISVPKNIEVEIENISGNITLGDLSNNVKIDLVNGDVSLERHTGIIECDITNGTFTGKIDSTSGININVINGNITLYLNDFINANVRAETVSGKITEENLQFSNVVKEKNLFKAKLGAYETSSDINIETVNGRIKLFGKNEI